MKIVTIRSLKGGKPMGLINPIVFRVGRASLIEPENTWGSFIKGVLGALPGPSWEFRELREETKN